MAHVLASPVMMITAVVRMIVYNTSTHTVQKEHTDHKMEIACRLQSGRATALHK